MVLTRKVLSLYAKDLTTGEISAHFAEIYGASLSKETVARITDRVLEEMAFWQNRSLDEVYAAIFIGAIGVTLVGERDFLGLWAGTGGEGAKFTDERAAARVAFEEITERWGKKYGVIVRLWENAGEDFIPFLSYDERDSYRDLLDQRH